MGADQERAGGAQRHLPRRPRAAARDVVRSQGAAARLRGGVRLARVGWSVGDLASELAELREALDEAPSPQRPEHEPDAHVVHETGDLLFAAVNVAGWRGSIPSWRCAPPPTGSAHAWTSPPSSRPAAARALPTSPWRSRTAGTAGRRRVGGTASDGSELLDVLLEYVRQVLDADHACLSESTSHDGPITVLAAAGRLTHPSSGRHGRDGRDRSSATTARWPRG